ncbi:hypothetical protein A9X01_13895 [Mycobacterium asiaticum]|uniref:Uncharacterized protein n=1 Tax=Mycobacterium asiaticum TaxID=1790 RepID=A0A1A3CR60_MYCAS|nr:hypothetical protein A9X01_13895 [Mycobacterium asiaticum]
MECSWTDIDGHVRRGSEAEFIAATHSGRVKGVEYVETAGVYRYVKADNPILPPWHRGPDPSTTEFVMGDSVRVDDWCVKGDQVLVELKQLVDRQLNLGRDGPIAGQPKFVAGQ